MLGLDAEVSPSDCEEHLVKMEKKRTSTPLCVFLQKARRFTRTTNVSRLGVAVTACYKYLPYSTSKRRRRIEGAKSLPL